MTSADDQREGDRGEGPTRILHLLSSSGLYGSDQVVLNVARSDNTISYVGALYNTHNPHVEVIDEADKRGLRTVVFNSRGRVDLRTIVKIRRFLRENQIDILHTHGYKSDVVGFLATLLGGTKWVATNHVWHGLGWRLKLYEAADAFVLRFASRIVAVSDEIKEDLVSKAIHARRVHVIDNGIDVDRFGQSRSVEALKAGWRIRDQDVVVTMVGRLAPEKGHKTFLEAARSVSSNRDNVKFLIVGDGRMDEELRALATSLNLDGRIIFAGFRRDISEIYALSDVMVNASSIEGLPMTILEAMASRVAVIATRAGGIPGVIKDDETGLLFDSQDADALTTKLASLIDDPDRRRRLAAAAFEFVAMNHSFKRMCDEYRQVYREVLVEE